MSDAWEDFWFKRLIFGSTKAWGASMDPTGNSGVSLLTLLSTFPVYYNWLLGSAIQSDTREDGARTNDLRPLSPLVLHSPR